MKTERRVIIASVGFGLLYWVVKAYLDTRFLSDGTFLQALLTDVPIHEICGRSFVFVIFLVSGLLTASILAKRKRTEGALVESETRFRQVYDHMAVGVARVSLDFHIEAANEAYCRMLGYREEELISKHLSEITHPDAIEENLRKQSQLVAGDIDHYRMEKRFIHKSGRVVHGILNANLVLDAEGKPLYCIGSVLDVTDRLDAEVALRESEERLKLALQGADLGTWDWNVSTGEVTFNQRWAKMLGYSLEEIGSHVSSWENLIHPDDLPAVMDALNAHLEGKTEVYRTEHRLRHKSGEYIWVLDKGRVIEWDADSNPIRACGTHLDITERKEAEEALRTAEHEKAVILDSVSELVSYQDCELRIVWANRAGAESVNMTTEELVGRHCYEIWQQLREPCPDCPVAKAMETGSPQEGQMTTPDGRVWNIKGYPVRGKDDEILGAVEVTLEITDRVMAERAMRERQLYLEGLLSAAPDAIVTLDPQNHIVDWNSGAEQLFGYQPQDAIGQNLDNLIARDEVIEEATAFTHLVTEGGTLAPTETVRYRQDGTPVNVIVSGAPIIVDDELMGIVAVYTNITKRKQAEEERERLLAQIREQAQRMEEILTTVPEGVLLLDAEGRVVTANPVAERNLAVLAGAKVGDTLSYLGDRSLESLLTSPPTKGLWHEVKANRHIFEVISRPMGQEAEPENWVLVLRDVTQERELEQRTHQQERLVAVGQLAAGIAHDFNNIMAVIVLYAQMGLRAPDLSSELRGHLEIIIDQAKRATDLIDQILDFTRRAKLERHHLDLVPFLKEMTKLLRRTLPDNIEIDLVYGSDVYWVSADPTRLQQMMMNLVFNARDAMPEGGALRIDLSTVAADETIHCVTCGPVVGETWVRISVSDTGVGITPKILPHIFEPFFTTKEIGNGTGLGLPQVYGIVKQHDGHIDVTTELEEGSTFILYLPIMSAPRRVSIVAEAETFALGEGETILVVEDNGSLREALSEMLATLNYHVLSAINGREALKVLDAHVEDVDLILSDVVMPEMGGEALFYALQERGFALPMVLLSGHPLENELQALQDQGLAGWLLKPPNIEQLMQLLARALKT